MDGLETEAYNKTGIETYARIRVKAIMCRRTGDVPRDLRLTGCPELLVSNLPPL